MSTFGRPALPFLCTLLLAACSRAHEGAERAASDVRHERDAAAAAAGNEPVDEDVPDDGGAETPSSDFVPVPPPPVNPPRRMGEPFDPDNFALRDPDVPGYVPGGSHTLPAPGFDEEPCAVIMRPLVAEPLHLAFLFDVSSDMGKGDASWNAREIKWDPLVRAARAFFEAESSRGLSASLSFFPGGDSQEASCSVPAYRAPAVAMSALPSLEFATAFAAATPATESTWRAGVSPLPAIAAVSESLRQQTQGRPGGFAIVLVINDDHTTADCPQDERLRAAVTEAGAAGFMTYVIGVQNPLSPNAPYNLPALNELAWRAGGEALLVRTGDAAETEADFARAMAALRENASACRVDISRYLRSKWTANTVRVRSEVESVRKTLRYNRPCSDGGGWRFVDAKLAEEVEFCPETCAALRGLPQAQVRLEYPCQFTYSR